MQRSATILLTLVLLVVGGPGWAFELCACGDEPKAACCCCHETEEGGAALSKARVCERVEVDKAASAPTTTSPASSGVAVPPGGVSLPRLAPATPLRSPTPAGASLARRGSDPPYLSVRSLRI